MKNCKSCDDISVCNQCKSGYYLNKAKTSCSVDKLECHYTCKTCIDNKYHSCISCVENREFVSSYIVGIG